MENSKEKFKNEFRKRAYCFGLNIIKLIETLDTRNAASRIISDQIIRSSTSIAANIIEARGASSKKDYANFFRHALKSANETSYWLSLLRDTKKIDSVIAENMLREVDELAKVIAKSIITLKEK
jgi:four helix bundle protein